jgi:cob(I)alamin adenosyltransferase
MPTIEELSARLEAAHDALRKSERLASVAHHAADAMEEASNPLETLSNLHYLIRHTSDNPEKVLEYLEEAETQALRLLEINTRILRLHREAMADGEGTSKEFVM